MKHFKDFYSNQSETFPRKYSASRKTRFTGKLSKQLNIFMRTNAINILKLNFITQHSESNKTFIAKLFDNKRNLVKINFAHNL